MTKMEKFEKAAKREGLAKQTTMYHTLKTILENGGKSIRPVYITGSGRHSRRNDYTICVRNILDDMGIYFVFENDAPRGGLCGNVFRIPRNRKVK